MGGGVCRGKPEAETSFYVNNNSSNASIIDLHRVTTTNWTFKTPIHSVENSVI